MNMTGLIPSNVYRIHSTHIKRNMIQNTECPNAWRPLRHLLYDCHQPENAPCRALDKTVLIMDNFC